MSEIAMELDRKLQTLDAPTAANVERLVRAALELAERREGVNGSFDAVSAHRAHIGSFAGIWAGDDFERPSQQM